MKKLKPNFALRTDGRTVTDDLNDLRADTERFDKVMQQLRDEITGVRPPLNDKG